MIMELTGILRQGSLEDVVETPRLMVSPIWTMKMDAIISSSLWMAIEVLLELIRKIMGSYRDLCSSITVFKYISEDSVTIF